MVTETEQTTTTIVMDKQPVVVEPVALQPVEECPWNCLTCDFLKKLLKDRALPVSGSKSELVERLKNSKQELHKYVKPLDELSVTEMKTILTELKGCTKGKKTQLLTNLQTLFAHEKVKKVKAVPLTKAVEAKQEATTETLKPAEDVETEEVPSASHTQESQESQEQAVEGNTSPVEPSATEAVEQQAVSPATVDKEATISTATTQEDVVEDTKMEMTPTCETENSPPVAEVGEKVVVETPVKSPAKRTASAAGFTDDAASSKKPMMEIAVNVVAV